MGYTDIDFHILKEVVDGLGRTFVTKDVSETSRMKQTHLHLVGNRNYHSDVGRALSEYRVQLGIDEVQKNTSRGSRWRKTNSLSAKSSYSQTTKPIHSALYKVLDQSPTSVESKSERDLGPQYSGDSPFAACMRKHQSWFRANVLRLPFGVGPTINSPSQYGNMLTIKDGEVGRNFLTSGIFEVVLDRINQGGGAIDPYRLLNNMLSSQPMCFNLFAPLALDLVLARKFLSTLVPEKVSEVIRVEFEWAPQPSVEYLSDRTAFDAFIEYRTENGELVGLGIETKLSEPFSQQFYDRPEYRRWMDIPGSPWRPDAYDTVQNIRHNQLWRDHLLAIALQFHPSSPYNKTRLMLVHHPEDLDCIGTFAGYKNLVKDDDDSLIILSIDQIINSWHSVVDSNDILNWILAFRMRYLDLALSRASSSS